jgi:hypothetical protein
MDMQTIGWFSGENEELVELTILAKWNEVKKIDGALGTDFEKFIVDSTADPLRKKKHAQAISEQTL